MKAGSLQLLLTGTPGKQISGQRIYCTHTVGAPKHTQTQTRYFLYVMFAAILIVSRTDPATMMPSTCQIITDSQSWEVHFGVCESVWSQPLLPFIKHKQCGISRESQWCNSTCKMQNFRAIYLDYTSQPKMKKCWRRVHWAWLLSLLAASLSCTIFSKSTSNLFCSFRQMPLSGGLGLGTDRHSKLNTWSPCIRTMISGT